MDHLANANANARDVYLVEATVFRHLTAFNMRRFCLLRVRHKLTTAHTLHTTRCSHIYTRLHIHITCTHKVHRKWVLYNRHQSMRMYHKVYLIFLRLRWNLYGFWEWEKNLNHIMSSDCNCSSSVFGKSWFFALFQRLANGFQSGLKW